MFCAGAVTLGSGFFGRSTECRLSLEVCDAGDDGVTSISSSDALGVAVRSRSFTRVPRGTLGGRGPCAGRGGADDAGAAAAPMSLLTAPPERGIGTGTGEATLPPDVFDATVTAESAGNVAAWAAKGSTVGGGGGAKSALLYWVPTET